MAISVHPALWYNLVMENNDIQSIGGYIIDIKNIIHASRNKVWSVVNAAMCEAYWLIGKRIVEEEQQGKHRAGYGKEIIRNLSQVLQYEFGTGFSERNLRNFRQFYLTFQDDEIWHTACAKLTWSHLLRLMRPTNKEARQYCLTEAVELHWTVKTLDRNISALYYTVQRHRDGFFAVNIVSFVKKLCALCGKKYRFLNQSSRRGV